MITVVRPRVTFQHCWMAASALQVDLTGGFVEDQWRLRRMPGTLAAADRRRAAASVPTPCRSLRQVRLDEAMGVGLPRRFEHLSRLARGRP